MIREKQRNTFGSYTGRHFSITVQPILKKVYRFGNRDSSASFPLLQPIRNFCSLTQKMGLQWAYRRLCVTQMADFDFI